MSIAAVKDRCDYLDYYKRRNYLHFMGIEEEPNETWKQSARKVVRALEENLRLPNIQLRRAQRVG